MKKYIFRLFLLGLFILGGTEYGISSSTAAKMDGGEVVLIVLEKQEVNFSLALPDIYIKNHKTLSLPLQISIYKEGKEQALYSITSDTTEVNLINLNLAPGDYKLITQIGKHTDSQNFNW